MKRVLANLAARLGETARTLLVALPVFVPHPRVAEQARALGVADVVVSGAADEDVLAALVATPYLPSVWWLTLVEMALMQAKPNWSHKTRTCEARTLGLVTKTRWKRIS